MPWVHLPQKGARWGEWSGRRRRPRSRRAPQADAGLWGQFRGLRRRRPPKRAHSTGVRKAPCSGGLIHVIWRPQRASTAPQVAREVVAQLDQELDLALRMSRFRGVQVDLVNVPNICCRKAPDLYVSSAKSARSRNSKNGKGPKRPERCAPRAPSQVGGRSSSRASDWLLVESAWTLLGSETAFIRPFDPAIFL